MESPDQLAAPHALPPRRLWQHLLEQVAQWSAAAGSDRCGQRATSRHEQIERRPQRAPCLARGTQQRLPVHVRSSSQFRRSAHPAVINATTVA